MYIFRFVSDISKTLSLILLNTVALLYEKMFRTTQIIYLQKDSHKCWDTLASYCISWIATFPNRGKVKGFPLPPEGDYGYFPFN